MPTAGKITSIITAPKSSPSTLCPAPSPGSRDPHCCLYWPASSLFPHTQTSGAAVQKRPPTSERPGREVTGRIQCPAVACSRCHLGFSLPPARSRSNTPSNAQSQGSFLFAGVQRVPTLAPRKPKASTASPSRPSL